MCVTLCGQIKGTATALYCINHCQKRLFKGKATGIVVNGPVGGAVQVLAVAIASYYRDI